MKTNACWATTFSFFVRSEQFFHSEVASYFLRTERSGICTCAVRMRVPTSQNGSAYGRAVEAASRDRILDCGAVFGGRDSQTIIGCVRGQLRGREHSEKVGCNVER